MSRMGMVAMMVLATLAIAGCAPQTGQHNESIAAGSEAWHVALNGGDVDAVAALYADDARVMPPNAEMGQGRDAVVTSFGELIDAGLGARLDTIEITSAGDVGYHVGNYAITAADGTVVDRGKYIEVWRQIGGEWKITDDIWNSDLPAVPETTIVSIMHQVKDGDAWLAAWQGEGSRHEMFAANGAPNVHVMHSPEMDNQFGLVVEVADMDSFMAWIQSPDSAAAKAEDGVLDKGFRVLMEVE